MKVVKFVVNWWNGIFNDSIIKILNCISLMLKEIILKKFLLKYLPIIVALVLTVIALIMYFTNQNISTGLLAIFMIISLGTDFVVEFFRKKEDRKGNDR